MRLSDHDGVMELEVADDGVGFDPDARPSVAATWD